MRALLVTLSSRYLKREGEGEVPRILDFENFWSVASFASRQLYRRGFSYRTDVKFAYSQSGHNGSKEKNSYFPGIKTQPSSLPPVNKLS